MFLPVPTPHEMSLWDKESIHIGVPETVLMENASREALHILKKTFGNIEDKYILVLMGSGKNGGDAVCLARHLHDAKANVLVLHTRSFIHYKGTTEQYLKLAKHCGILFTLAGSWITKYNKTSWGEPDIIIDGLIGTGLSSNLQQLELELINTINKFSKKSFILSLDIPSGLSGLTGKPQPTAIKADITVTFEAAKPGLILPEASNYVGALHICSIGIPLCVRKRNPPSYQMINQKSKLPLPNPQPMWYKGNAGHLLIIGGSSNSDGILTGAPHLTALAALRTGAGLVTVAAPYKLCNEIKANCPDIMMLPLGTPETYEWGPDLVEQILSRLHKYNCIVIGPGIGRTIGTTQFIAKLLSTPSHIPKVIDADALIALADETNILKNLNHTDILTPHPGEAATLLKTNTTLIQKNRFDAIHQLTSLSSSTWILKGTGTMIASPQSPTTIFPQAIPNLAIGGSGDVLSGCVGTLLIHYHKQPHIAACLATQLHLEAGAILSKQFLYRGNTALDIANAIPNAYINLMKTHS